MLLRPFLPAIVAVLSAHLLCPEIAPMVAFPAGVIGVLIGADLIRVKAALDQARLREFSIGGAGTLDGVLAAGVLAALLA